MNGAVLQTCSKYRVSILE